MTSNWQPAAQRPQGERPDQYAAAPGQRRRGRPQQGTVQQQGRPGSGGGPRGRSRGRSGGRSQPTEKQLQRARAREARWESRYAVPYPTDGPKVVLGMLWFLALVAALLLGEYAESRAITVVALVLVLVPVSLLAGLQTGYAWFPRLAATRGWTAAAAALVTVCGAIGPIGLVVGVLIGVMVLGFYLALYKGHQRAPMELFDVLARSSLPVGLATGSMLALGRLELGALVSLILLISAYEMGDFLVGSGAANAVEGPLAGFVAMGAITFLLFLVQPAPFDGASVLVFSVVAAVCAVGGQRFASALLPRGNAWAPALRRLDSYLVAAPLWLLLLVTVPLPGAA